MAKEQIRGNNPAGLTKTKKAKIEEFVNLYRGGPEEIRGNCVACFKVVYPKGKSPQAQRRNAHTLYNHPYTQKLLSEIATEIAEKADVTQERVIKEISAIAFFDPRKLFKSDGTPKPLHELDDATAAAVSSIKKIKMNDDWETLEYKIADKNSALEKLMRHLGLYQQDNEQKNVSLADALKAGIQRIKDLDG